MSSAASATTDHDRIRAWAEERDAIPATARGTQESGGGPGVLTFDMAGAGAGEEDLEHVDWDAWFEKFERERLALLHQDETADGETSRFFKLVARE